MPTTTDLAEPIRADGKGLSIAKTWVSEKQITQMVSVTPKQFIYKRPAKGGGTWDYVTVAYVQKVLDFTFGFNWDFEVVQHGKEQDHVWVLGKLTVKSPDGSKTITKQQFGRSEVKHKSGTKENLDYGNDLKSATSDALKKCASMLGIARDVYSKTDYKMESGKDARSDVPTIPPGGKMPPTALKPGQVKGPDGDGVYICSETGDIISDQEYEYSMKMYGKPLSREAQKNHKPKK